MQLCGFHCTKGTVFAFWLFFPCIFINYCDYHVNHREFLWLVVASGCQMSSDINILHHSYQQLVHITRNGLNTKCSLHFSAYFTFLSILVNFPLTGNDICHSQPKPWHFIISNASCSINLFLAQWRHISSESAVALLLRMCSISIKYDAKSKVCDILLVLTSVAGNLCNKCTSSSLNKTAVKVILLMRSLVSIEQQSPRRPCDIKLTCIDCSGSNHSLFNFIGKLCGPKLRTSYVWVFFLFTLSCVNFFSCSVIDAIFWLRYWAFQLNVVSRTRDLRDRRSSRWNSNCFCTQS